MTDVFGLIRLGFFVVTHPFGTYRFLKDISVVIRCLTLDVFGRTTPIHRRDDRDNK